MIPAVRILNQVLRFNKHFSPPVNSSTNFQERKSCPEAARDLQLVVQLVSWTGRPRDQPEQVEGSTDHHINLWIKASIMKRDLSLEQRRRPKGETK